MSELPQWYDCIENPLKELVYALRNNGFNTISSCGHYPTPEIELRWLGSEEILKIADLLIGKRYKNWELSMNWNSISGMKWLDIKFYPEGWLEKEHKDGLVPLSEILRSKSDEGYIY